MTTKVSPTMLGTLGTSPGSLLADGGTVKDWFAQAEAGIEEIGLPPYIGQVATRCGIPRAGLAPATATWSMARSMHWSRDRIVNPTVIFANYYVNASYVETGFTAGTIKAAIEYPAGVFTLANEGTATFNVGYTSLTFNIKIPENRQFWVRFLIVNANGMPFSGGSLYQTYDLSEGLAYGTGAVSDFVTSGTVPKSFQGRQAMSPVAIVARTKKRSAIILGTSKETGIADRVTDATGDVGTVARIIGNKVAYINMSYASSLLSAYISATRTYQDQLFQYITDVINAHAINDVQSGGDTATALAGRRTALAALYPGKTIVGCTSGPKTNYPSATSVSITSLTRSGTVATATVASTASLTTGQTVNIAGVTGSSNYDFLGAKKITVVNGTTFTFAVVSDQTATTAPGTITYNDIYSTTSGQVIDQYGVIIQSFNQLVRAGITGEHTYLDLSDACDPYRTGLWPVSRNPTATSGPPATYTTDGLHENSECLELMRDRAQGQLARLGY